MSEKVKIFHGLDYIILHDILYGLLFGEIEYSQHT